MENYGYSNYINSVAQEFGGDFSRPTKFVMDLTFPSNFMADIYKPQMDVLCKNVQLPGVGNGAVELRYKGHNIYIPGRTNYGQDLNLTFYVDEKHNIKQGLERWVRMLDPKNLSGEGAEGVPNSKVGMLKLTALNFDENQQAKVYTFHNIFPTTVSSPNFGGDSPSSVNEISVTFFYSHYYVSNTDLNLVGEVNEFMNGIVNDVTEGIGNLFGVDGRVIRKGLPAIVDIFKKGNRW
jgi:hypothetical protein